MNKPTQKSSDYLPTNSANSTDAIINNAQEALKPRLVTFTCANCLNVVTQYRLSYRLPIYCGQDCRQAAVEKRRIARKAANKQRLLEATTGKTKVKPPRQRRRSKKKEQES